MLMQVQGHVPLVRLQSRPLSTDACGPAEEGGPRAGEAARDALADAAMFSSCLSKPQQSKLNLEKQIPNGFLLSLNIEIPKFRGNPGTASSNGVLLFSLFLRFPVRKVRNDQTFTSCDTGMIFLLHGKMLQGEEKSHWMWEVQDRFWNCFMISRTCYGYVSFSFGLIWRAARF